MLSTAILHSALSDPVAELRDVREGRGQEGKKWKRRWSGGREKAAQGRWKLKGGGLLCIRHF